MNTSKKTVRVLYSFPHKIGTSRICNTAWQLVNGAAAAGTDIHLFAGVLSRPLPASVRVTTTLARGRLRIPYKLLGKVRALQLHDRIVSSWIEKHADEIDVIHTWPVAALKTLKNAKRLGIPTVLERPNAHTRFAYEVVRKECERLGVQMPPDHEHAYHDDILRIEEAEYDLADRLLCPSDFVLQTFVDAGFPLEKLARHQYGFDHNVYTSEGSSQGAGPGLTMLFVGGVAPRKGLHFALEAWLASPAHVNGTFLIAGEFIPGYAEKMASLLAHPSVKRLGHRHDVADLMKKSDLLVLPSIEEGSALVTSEARGSGCVLVVSEAAGAICKHMENALVHRVGDVKQLTEHLRLLSENRDLLHKLRESSLRTVNELTWASAGACLANVYRELVEQKRDAAAISAGANERVYGR
jgi:glycosyltransferase involved in cell wall biosynthesis